MNPEERIDERIQQMSPRLAEVIAAGEVIERPASAVKELVENSLDAGATEIEVRITKGGKVALEVIDDGRGIHPGDLLLAIARHATSKLKDQSDLHRIRTFGFRGEALASMAAVGTLTIESRAQDATDAAGVRCEPGKPPEGPWPVGRHRGTRVILEQLFATIPARKKFLRSDQNEGQRIRDIVKTFTVAHPEVGFRLVSGERLRMNLAPSTLDQRLADLYDDVRWLEVTGEGARFRLNAVLSGPHDHRSNGSDLQIFVNRRFVRDPLLRKAVQAGYEGVIPPARWPLGAVFLDVLPEDIDVNVHPAKTEIRFLNPGGMFAEIRGAIQAALQGKRDLPGRRVNAPPAAPGYRQPALETYPVAAPPAQHDGVAEAPVPNDTYASTAPPTTAQHVPENTWSHLNLVPLGDIGQRYLVFKENDELLLVDQHAAHERVRYDRIIAVLESGENPRQSLLVPEVFQAEPAELEGFRLGGEWLYRIGFEIDIFGPETLRIRSVPKWFQGDPRPAARETLRQIADFGSANALHRAAHDIAASLACKGAILSGRNVPEIEQLQLLQQLLDSPGGETCPHGRPTYRRMRKSELDRWFGR